MKTKTSGRIRHLKQAAACVVFAAMLAGIGCAALKQPRGPQSAGVQESGFLQDLYPLMQEGETGQVLRVYRNPLVDTLPTNAYDKIWLDAVTLYYGPQSKLKDLPQEQYQALADLFSGKVAEALTNDFELVTRAGPKTLRIQIALTDMKETKTTLKVLSFIPWGIPGLKFAILKTKETLTGKPVLSGDVTAEAKILDSQTGAVLWAGVDRRVGGRLRGGWKSWTDVEAAFQFWAEKIRFGLNTQLRHRTDLSPPEE